METEINEQKFQRAEIFIKVSYLHRLFSSLGHLPILSTVRISDLVRTEGLREAEKQQSFCHSYKETQPLGN